MATQPPNPPRPQPPDTGLSVEAIATELRTVARHGLERITAERQRPLLALRSVQRQATDAGYPDSDEGLTLALRDVITDALRALGDGASGQAARLLFGAVPDSRGRDLAERRRMAGDCFEVVASTFRRSQEPQLIADLATELLRVEHKPDLKLVTDTEPSTDPPAESAPLHVVIDTPTAAIEILHPSAPLRAVGHSRRSEWFLLGLFGAIAIWRIWDFGAALRVAVLALAAGLVATVVGIVRTGSDRAGITRGVLENLPRLVLLGAATLFGIGALATTDTGDTTRPRPDPCAGVPSDPLCTTTTTGGPSTTTNAQRSPYYVPVTVAPVPAERAPDDCPPEGNHERRLSFVYNPPACLDFAATYQATVVTNFGTFRILLNTARAPWTVNNFVYLARWRFFDGITLTPSPQPAVSSTVMLAGDPVGPDDVDKAPGYTLTFDNNTYPDLPVPDNERFWVFMTNPNHPNLWTIAITADAQTAIADNPNRWPLAGQVSCGIDVIANDTPDGHHQPAYTSAAIVIDHLTIEALTPDQAPPLQPGQRCDNTPENDRLPRQTLVLWLHLLDYPIKLVGGRTGRIGHRSDGLRSAHLDPADHTRRVDLHPAHFHHNTWRQPHAKRVRGPAETTTQPSLRSAPPVDEDCTTAHRHH